MRDKLKARKEGQRPIGSIFQIRSLSLQTMLTEEQGGLWGTQSVPYIACIFLVQL